jgi:NADH:ubiquinone oxidoreductase subunit 6 (subunit J)
MMHWSFFIIAAVTIVSALAAISLRNIVHCALLLTVTFAGIAAFYLQLNAQFVGFAQVLVYIGAVAILIVFAILLTRSSDIAPGSRLVLWWGSGMVIALAVFATLAQSITKSTILKAATSARVAPQPPSVRDIGTDLMNRYVLPLEILALLLTAALIGAAVIALQEKRRT